MLDTRPLIDTMPQTGRLEWIGLRPARQAPIQVVTQVEVLAGKGLVGDRATNRTRVRPSKRQVTLFQSEHLPLLTSIMGLPVAPEMLRRNLHISGINLHAFKGRRFRIGTVLFEHTGLCDPCSKMERTLGPGGLNAMRMHCGITTRVIHGGVIRLGDPVRLEH